MNNLSILEQAKDFASPTQGSNCFAEIFSEAQKSELQKEISPGFPPIEEDVLVAVTDFNFSNRGVVLVKNDGACSWFKVMSPAPTEEVGKRWGPFLPPPWQKRQ